MSEFITLNTGAKMPTIGLGTWKSEPNKVGAAVEYALSECGYKHIDCASIYGNEKEIGQAFAKIFSADKIKREELFITSKLWNDAHDPNIVKSTCRKTLSDLRLEYLDLYLMHWGVASPTDGGSEPLDVNGVLKPAQFTVRDTWEAMENLYNTGLVKAVGLANFTAPMIIDLLAYAKIVPAINQIELHPYNQQTRLVKFCQQKNIAVTAYSPLGSPGNNKHQNNPPMVLKDEVINKIAQKYQKTPAQVILRWAVQRDTIAIPKSITPERIKENTNIFGFELTGEEMDLIGKLDRHFRFVDPFGWWGVPYFD
ncbi:MAG: hypothetical protein A3J93_04120 [Candidatus Magasanikbacteria bacterium RIFOXYC2_FULL_42_28]|uniref:NADP-dependent oxidoreductase domain-containing protein n=1 Tax=Candidatus Magasanikbacteria bacterium RIFOXYC2_FULL_42_28 TaxID=1798704 RepID=A0A1F6NY00_9BACT|nr:MAG: hypothetical protein A3J93_04120 [Candidatus Magasanikbacteria bacterium RIFOXYC2_FULL_42_28]